MKSGKSGGEGGIICPLHVEIGLTDLPNLEGEWGAAPLVSGFPKIDRVKRGHFMQPD